MRKALLPQHTHKTALLLSGGGARGAYQVGVLKAIASFYPRNHGIPFPILCGTSAGAMNSTALGCYAPCFHLGVKKLEWIWRNMKTEQIYRSDFNHVTRYMFNNVTKWLRSDLCRNRPTSLLDNTPLRGLLKQFVPFERLERNISKGYLHALSVTASSYKTGNSVSFFQGHSSIDPWKRSKRESMRDLLHFEHLMASAALPLVFPAIEVRQAFYGDGSIHQLSPLSTPIHLGADKILCIGLDSPHDQPAHSLLKHPSASSIAGHLLDSVFSDTLESDIERAQRINTTIESLPEDTREQLELRPVDIFLINPSVDINGLAHRYFDDIPLAIRLLLASMGVTKSSESSLVSYLLFEQAYCQELIAAGYNDGMAQQQQLMKFLDIKNLPKKRKHSLR
ncbi:patatin-like phospholipase family protein [Psychrobium sp. 1_MG-2023]|uniref:patatin-like phospholipase family protein n=1 Tax=Psychrobium sp. 1_MG-2023 TaxID=3062624 RepID=UPI002736E93A|nr:patatin-like phospholipase family protein [Psychrobium sp. 1_MG-2023]MDP2559977.1 patatin-like phospholipase family protein [Psychrobium sp. 1_MG-2023]